MYKTIKLPTRISGLPEKVHKYSALPTIEQVVRAVLRENGRIVQRIYYYTSCQELPAISYINSSRDYRLMFKLPQDYEAVLRQYSIVVLVLLSGQDGMSMYTECTSMEDFNEYFENFREAVQNLFQLLIGLEKPIR